MKRALLIVLLLTGAAEAKTRAQLLLDFRKATMDLGSAASMLVYPDSVVSYYLNAAMEYAAVRSLAYTKHDTITMSPGDLDYNLTRKAIMPRSGKVLYEDGNTQGVGYLTPAELATYVQDGQGWTLFDSVLSVTHDIANKYKFIVQYCAMPASMDSAGADCELPNVLEHAIVNRAVGIAYIATKIPPLVEQGGIMAADARQAFDDYAVRNVLLPSDSARTIAGK